MGVLLFLRIVLDFELYTRGGGYVGSGVTPGMQIRRGILQYRTRYRLEYPEWRQMLILVPTRTV